MASPSCWMAPAWAESRCIRASGSMAGRSRRRPLQAPGDGGAVQGLFADDDQGRHLVLAGLPGAIEIGGDAGADGLDGQARGRAGYGGEPLEAQDIVAADRVLDNGEQVVLAPDGGKAQREAVEIVVLMGFPTMFELVMAGAIGDIGLAFHAHAEQGRD